MHPKIKANTHSGKRKRSARKPLPEPKPGGPLLVRSSLSAGNVANTMREGVQYTRRANRRARANGFNTATAFAHYLLAMYEYAKKLHDRRR